VTDDEIHRGAVDRENEALTLLEVPAPSGYLILEVHQASGMVAAQLHCTPDEALARMTTRALDMGYAIDEMAFAVLDRSIRFDG